MDVDKIDVTNVDDAIAKCQAIVQDGKNNKKNVFLGLFNSLYR